MHKIIYGLPLAQEFRVRSHIEPGLASGICRDGMFYPFAGLYRDGILKQPKGYAYKFPDLLAFHDAPTSIEQSLYLMFSEYRMRTFMGTFHANPDYAFWYGWAEMRRSLTEIKEKETELRKAQGKRKR